MLQAIGWLIGIIAAYSLIKVAWDKLPILLSGKRIAVLGEREVGKTHLIRFLSTGTIPMDYEATLDPKKAKGRKFNLRELNLVLKDMLDMSGAEHAYKVWKQEFDKADIVFYLFRADRFFRGNQRTQTRVEKDLAQIQLWFDEQQAKRPTLFLIGTHCDLMSEYKQINPNQRADFNDKLLSMDVAK